MKGVYWQKGESLDYANTGNTVIEANTVIDLKTRIAVAGTSINPGEKGSVHVTGVYEMEKSGNGNIEMGMMVYFDGNGITGNSDNGKTGDDKKTYTPAGYAAEDSAEEKVYVLVKLLG